MPSTAKRGFFQEPPFPLAGDKEPAPEPVEKTAEIKPKRTQATLREVAEKAGVSQMTVSRALNAPEMVRKPTRDKIRAAIEELNYRPNLMARSLAAGRSLFIGVGYNNPSSAYLSELLLGSLRACREAGHHLVVEELADAALKDPVAVATRLRDSGLDGIIIAPPLSENSELAAAIRRTGMPLVLLSPGPETGHAVRIVIDDRAAAMAMTKHLIALGHTHIGFIEGPVGDYQTEQRLLGYKSALEDAAMTVGTSLIKQGAFTYKSGMDAMAKLLSGKQKPTAVFAANDDMAAGAVAEAHRQGLRVPEDISVAGFDDTSLASTVWPSLTTVRQPIAEMAGRAVELLSQSSDLDPSAEYQLDISIVERESVAPPRAD